MFLDGADIAYKWGDAGRGGWYHGQVTLKKSNETVNVPFGLGNDKQINASVFFPHDGETVDCALYYENCTIDPKQETKKHYWVLLDASPLGEDVHDAAVRGILRAPGSKRQSGKQQQKRFKPLYGPTSDQAHKQARKK